MVERQLVLGSLWVKVHPNGHKRLSWKPAFMAEGGGMVQHFLEMNPGIGRKATQCKSLCS